VPYWVLTNSILHSAIMVLIFDSFFIFIFYCYAGRGYVVAHTKVLKIY
jgi:hypothetical protein